MALTNLENDLGKKKKAGGGGDVVLIHLNLIFFSFKIPKVALIFKDLATLLHSRRAQR